MRLCSSGRALDPKARIDRLVSALALASEGGATHLVVSGDLTETGTTAQFETLAEVLSDARIDPDRVTLVPGNHDTITREGAWSRAIAGPLSRFRRASAAGHPDRIAVVERARAFFLPLDVACHQAFPLAAGEIGSAAAVALERTVRDVSGRGKAVVVVLHHGPVPQGSRAWEAVHGLRGGERLLDILARYPDVHALHGHLHHEADASVDPRRPRIFGAAATIDDRRGSPRVRLYDVLGSSVRVAPRARTRGLAA